MKKLQTILLTGATEFLCGHLLEALVSKGYKVIILKRSTSNTWHIDNLLDKCVSYDVDTQSLELAFEEQHIDVVMHMACHYGRNTDPMAKVVESNLIFGLRILDACLKFDTNTLLQKHLNIYTLSKKQFLEWLKQTSDKIQVVNLKLEHMYGSKDDTTKFVPWVLSQLKTNVPVIKLTLADQERDFIYIDDVVSAFFTVLDKLPDLASFNEFDVGTGQLLLVKSFLQNLKKTYEASFGLSTTKLVFGAIDYRVGEMMTVEVTNQKLLDLDWIPKNKLENGLMNIIKEYA